MILLMIMIMILPLQFTSRTSSDKNIAMNLHDLFFRNLFAFEPSARVQIINVLRQKQELARESR